MPKYSDQGLYQSAIPNPRVSSSLTIKERGSPVAKLRVKNCTVKSEVWYTTNMPISSGQGI